MKTTNYFNTNATQWNEMRKGFFNDEVAKTAADASGLQAGQKAADIGAGTGFLTKELVDRGVNVIAIDPSEQMLEQLKRNVPSERVVTRIAQAESLPLVDFELDAVLANMCLHHVEVPEAAIAEMVRVIASGGRVVITDLTQHEFDWLLKEHDDRWPGFAHEEVRKWMEDAGLKSVKVEAFGQQCCATSCGCQSSASVEIFLAVGVKP